MIIHRRRQPGVGDDGGLAPGTMIAGYRVEQLLGSGGMGTVYEATQLSLKRRIALKVITPGVGIDQTLRSRFRREGEVQAGIDHLNILPVYEAGEDNGRLFIAMRLVRGHTLKSLVASRGLSAGAALQLLGQVASGLDSAHSAGLVHRDVKPQNILVDQDRHAYLADFGLSRARGDATLTRSGQILGSVSYIPPEVVRGEPATAEGDLYSFTCVAYECLVGLVPFPRESDHAVLHAHVWDPIPNASDINPELPVAVDAVLAQGMAKHPEDRQPTATQIVGQLQAALGLEPAPARESQPVTRPGGDSAESATFVRQPLKVDAPPPARTPWRRVGLAIAAVALCAAAIGWATGPSAGQDTDNAHGRPAAARASAAYAAAVSSAFQRLERARAPAARALGEARSERSQAHALDRLAADYSTARAAVTRAPAVRQASQATRAIAASLLRISTDYRRLAGAARRNDRTGFRRRGAALTRDQRRLSSAVSALRPLGFELR